MADVPTSTYPGTTPAQYTDALDHLSQLAAGTSNINTHPGLMNALMTSRATPAQAQALNQYMAGVTAQNRMTLARAGGGKADFSDDERNAMNAMGVNYSEVDQRTAQLAAVNNGLGAAAGSSSSSGTAAPQSHDKKPSHGWWDHGVLHGLSRAGYDVLHNPGTDAMSSGYNLVNASLGGVIDDIESTEQRLGITTERFGPNGALLLPSSESKHGAALHAQRAIQMKALGYDPNSVWSSLAFDSHGYSRDDLDPSAKAYNEAGGQGATGWDSDTALIKALQFSADPKKFQEQILQDQSLTPDQVAQQLQALNSQQFIDLIQRVNGQQQTFGHQAARSSGLDPVKNAKAYAITAAATDLVTSFYIDPTMVLGRVVGGVRKLPLAMDSLQDTETIATRLDPHLPANQFGARARVLTGWQSMLDSTNRIRESIATGDQATAAAEYASIQRKTPELVPLVGDFLGGTQGKLRSAADDLGIAFSSDILKAEAGKPITNLAEATAYITSIGGLQRLVSGKAAVESAYMPGAVSRFGLRALRANRAAHAARADVLRQERAEAEFLEARQTGSLSSKDQAVSDEAIRLADPGVPTHETVNLNNVRKIAPEADDAVEAETGRVISESTEAEQGLKSASRATGDWADNLLPAEKGLVAYNMRRYGSAVAPEGMAPGGWASPAAFAARARLAAARFSSLLPINTTIDLADANSATKVRQYARFYLGKGAANNLAAQFANGDLATRKTIVQGLFTQVAHAAGLSRTDAGRQILKDTDTGIEAYTHAGPGWIVNGRQIALHQGQTTTSMSLPSFKQLTDASSRVGLYEATAGRLATRTATDNLFNLYRIGILIRPATATRNIIEPYLKASLDGQFGAVLKARALTYASSDELARIGEKLGVTELTGKVPAEVLAAAKTNLEEKVAGGASKHEISVAKHTLARVEMGDISAMAGYGRTRVGSKMSDTLAHLTKFYHGALLRTMSEAELRHVDELAEVLPQMTHNFGEMVVADRFSPEGATAIRDVTNDGLAPINVKYNIASGDHPLLKREELQQHRQHFTRTGFGLETTDNSVGMARYVNALHSRTYASPETAKAVIAALRNTDEQAGRLVDTRGAGIQYHGTPKPVSDLRAGYYNESNIFGGTDTLYTTDAADIAHGYTRKSAAGAVYRVDEKRPVKFFDMEKQQSSGELERLFGLDGSHADSSEFVRDAITSVQDANGNANLRQVMNAIRRSSAESGYSKHDVQELFDSVSDNLQTAGFGGMRHIGGMGTNSVTHNVKIYLNPSEQVSLVRHDLEREAGEPAGPAGVVSALESENSRGTAFGKYFRPAGDGVAVPAVTPDEIAVGKTQWAQDVINDYKYLLTNHDGQMNEKLTDFIGRHGKAPDERWFADNLSRDEMPARVLAPQYEAAPIGGHQMLPQALQDLGGRVFNQVVEGSIKRQSSMPFLAAHYLNARVEQEAAGMMKTLTEAGLSPESSKTLLMGQAIRSSYVRTAQMIDDPGQKAQFDIVARNLFMFPRAMQAFVRRWGGSLASDPFKARKMFLALEASEHSGVVYKDENGELTFTYPGSAVMRDAMVAVSKLPGFGGIAKFPVGMDMTGKLMMAAPGFDNPLRFSMSPMINVPMREVFKMFPEHQSLWTEIDTALNGEVGASMAHQGIVQSILPSAISKLMAAHNEDERNSIFASAVTGAIAHLSAAGLAPDPSDPPAVQDRFINQVKAQVRNQLYLRFAFGLVAPAAPSNLNENIDNASTEGKGSGTAADYTFHTQGIRNLSGEYKSILAATTGDVARATAIFVAMHPEGLAYTIPSTGATANKAYLPATRASMDWMEGNLNFLNKYKSVGAYFLPKEDGDFDHNAYNAQLQLGLRQKKSISEFYRDVQVSQASATYFQEYDKYQQLRGAALASYDLGGSKQMGQAWQLWKTDFLDKHPMLKQKFAETSENTVNGERQIADLQEMVKNGEVPDGLAPQVGQMVTLFHDYLDWKRQVPAGAEGAAQKQAVAQAVDEGLGKIAAQDPRLTNLFNAVFRSVDRSLTTVVVNDGNS